MRRWFRRGSRTSAADRRALCCRTLGRLAAALDEEPARLTPAPP